jgi:hydrogenase maturation protease
MKILVLGLGNPLLGDDGIGWRVAEQIRPLVTNPVVEVDCLAGGGLSLMERVIGYDRVVLIDALFTGQSPPGTVSSFELAELPNSTAGHLSSAHETSLTTALQLGLKLGLALPGQIRVVAIEAEHVYDFSEELTSPVAAALPEAVQRVIELGWFTA